MLVLSRKSTEKISIGKNITIEVRRIAGNRVTLAIEAPRDIRILRGELEPAATDFEVTVPADTEPADTEPVATELVATELVATELAAAETYQVSHHRAPLADFIPTSSPASVAAG